MPTFLRPKTRVLAIVWMLASGCGGATPLVVPQRPTMLVRVVGDGTHLVGTEVARDAEGHVEVVLNEGRRVWVDATRVSPLVLEVGTHVVTRWNDTVTLYRGDVTARFGELIEVLYTDGSRVLVALPNVLAVSDEPLTSTDATPTHATTPATTSDVPVADPSTLAVIGEVDVWAAARAVRCDDGVIVLFADGSARVFPEADVRDASFAAVGARVAARYNDDSLSYLARIREIHDGRATVVYDDDASEEVVRMDQLTYVLADPASIAPTLATPTTSAGARRAGALCRSLRQTEIPTVFVRVARAQRVGVVGRCVGQEGRELLLRDASTADENALERTVARAEVGAFTIATGDRVLVPWGQSHFFATIVQLDAAVMHVRYEDGSEDDVPIGKTMMRLVAPDAPQPTTFNCASDEAARELTQLDSEPRAQ